MVAFAYRQGNRYPAVFTKRIDRNDFVAAFGSEGRVANEQENHQQIPGYPALLTTVGEK